MLEGYLLTNFGCLGALFYMFFLSLEGLGADFMKKVKFEPPKILPKGPEAWTHYLSVDPFWDHDGLFVCRVGGYLFECVFRRVCYYLSAFRRVCYLFECVWGLFI